MGCEEGLRAVEEDTGRCRAFQQRSAGSSTFIFLSYLRHRICSDFRLVHISKDQCYLVTDLSWFSIPTASLSGDPIG